ncbi:hypothetical protein [Herbaspirillum sp. NPDC087042]|uniref:hypothetical protein n=1 Tax=Herbaspirillum sp. NPDC087042 TaxID=3364004 RepID=UPI00380A8AE7
MENSKKKPDAKQFDLLQKILKNHFDEILAQLPEGAKRESMRDIINFRTSLSKETDRGAALMAAAFLDERLMCLLRNRLVNDKKMSKVMFDFNGPLGTFSSRINFCYLLGLLPKNVHRELHIVRSIRNKFAHRADFMDFEDPSTKSLCNSLIFHGVKPAASAGSKFRRTVMGLLTVVELVNGETLHIVARKDYPVPDRSEAYLRVAEIYKDVTGEEYFLKYEHE